MMNLPALYKRWLSESFVSVKKLKSIKTHIFFRLMYARNARVLFEFGKHWKCCYTCLTPFERILQKF